MGLHFLQRDAAVAIGVGAHHHASAHHATMSAHAPLPAFAMPAPVTFDTARFAAFGTACLARFAGGLALGSADRAVAVGIDAGDALLAAQFTVGQIEHAVIVEVHLLEALCGLLAHVGAGHGCRATLRRLGDGGGACQQRETGCGENGSFHRVVLLRLQWEELHDGEG